MTKKMQIKLMPNGEIKMETIGVKGKKCDDYVELFKKLVDAKIIDFKHTDEYYETEDTIETDSNTQIRTEY
jgi:hypothetical protein